MSSLHPPQPQPATHPRPTLYLPTTETYNKWAAVYDTDNNFLQALDDAAQHSWLPALLHLAGITPSMPASIVDLGCGTGRTTLAIAALAPSARIRALDASPAMLDVARAKTPGEVARRIEYRLLDLLDADPAADHDVDATDDSATQPEREPEGGDATADPHADALVSTLVLEHIPLSTFFAAVARRLRRGGAALVTNMHADMGALSQAGFVDVHAGVKVRAVSYVHALDDVVDAAGRVGLRAVRVEERGVEEGDEGVFGPRCRKWVGIKCWFGILFRFEGVGGYDGVGSAGTGGGGDDGGAGTIVEAVGGCG